MSLQALSREMVACFRVRRLAQGSLYDHPAEPGPSAKPPVDVSARWSSEAEQGHFAGNVADDTVCTRSNPISGGVCLFPPNPD
jgi:hypothetical protein